MKFKLIKTTVLLFVIVSFFSCKKDSSSSSGYYVKLKVNGNWTTMTKVAAGELVVDGIDPTKMDLGIHGNDDGPQNVFNISIQVSGSTFNTGSYASDNYSYWVNMSYVKDASTAAMKSFDIDNAPSMPASKYTVNITSINSSEVKGTFTGNYLYDSYSGEKLNITDGEFFVKRI